MEESHLFVLYYRKLPVVKWNQWCICEKIYWKTTLNWLPQLNLRVKFCTSRLTLYKLTFVSFQWVALQHTPWGWITVYDYNCLQLFNLLPVKQGNNKVMAHPELLKSKVLFKLKHRFPVDLKIELVYRLNLKVFQFLLEFCEKGLICLLWFFTKLKVLKVYIEILQSKEAIYLDCLSCYFWCDIIVLGFLLVIRFVIHFQKYGNP